MDWEEELSNYINEYFEAKNESDKYKKIVDQDNKEIKELMKNIGMDEFTNDYGLTAKISIAKKETFNEPALIEKLKELNASEAIELVPTINWDTIEDMIYNGKLNASELTPFKEEKEIVTLRVTRKKVE